jgi:hypothetical protein
MTSNYDKYVRPEMWPIPAEHIGYLFEGRNLPGGMVEIRCGHSRLDQFVAGKTYILDAVPREHVREAVNAIIAYRDAYRKLTG